MRKLLNTLFVTSEDAYLTLETENVAVYIREEKKAQYPLLVLESIISFSYKGASPALMGACARQGIQLTFLTPRGRFLARVCGQEQGNVLLLKEQYRTIWKKAAALPGISSSARFTISAGCWNEPFGITGCEWTPPRSKAPPER